MKSRVQILCIQKFDDGILASSIFFVDYVNISLNRMLTKILLYVKSFIYIY